MKLERLPRTRGLRHALSALAALSIALVTLALAGQATAQTDSVRIVADNAYGVTFQNGDGKWTIYKACFGPAAHGGRNVTVGPGYIGRVERDNGNGTFTTIVNDERAYRSINSPAAGGLGTFGSHVASKNGAGFSAEALSYDRAWFIDGRRCAGDDWNEGLKQPAGATGIGVAAARIVEQPSVRGGVGRLAIDVDFKDNQAPGILLTVRYRYRIQKSVVRLWTTVTPQPAYENGREYIKEPKFGFAISGGSGYRRLSVLTRKGSLARNAIASNHRGNGADPKLCYWIGAAASNDQVRRTGQCDADLRYRLRFDFDGRRAPTGHASASARRLALNVVGASATRADAVGAPTRLWEQPATGSGLASWGAQVRSQRGKGVLQFASRDSAMGGAQWDCHVGVPKERAFWQRWELVGGTKTRSGTYTAATALLKGWDGGTGAYDCEPLSMHDGRAGVRFGNFFSISIGPGWTSS